MRIALGAFGLQDDLNSKFFIKKVLEGGVENPKSLANRLADKRYFEMASAFGFGGTGAAAVTENGFADKIIGLYQSRSFEVAVGESDENLRLALGLRRDLAALARKDASEDTKWFTIMGAAPLRKVFEVAFSLPKSFGTIDIDKQLETLKQKSRQAFGDASVSQFADPERIEALTRRFLLRADLAAVSQQFSGGSIALQLLQSARFQR
ncbi:DUF1217 domain-containing protein [Plastorhodobacter daqingensis]|uniref:DUF1217 domain-containing protein n=1 Tax=Plastorhodobacter daqingensis TaxID=1387281 RepID=A0ABW2UD68_9RHOB